MLESGVGSGALSMAMLRAGADIVGYELREDFATRAQENVASFLGEEALSRYRVELRDCYDGIDETDLDRVVLDLPEPWQVVKHAERALHPGGILLAYTPSITQVVQLREALEASAFDMPETLEVLNRTWHVEGQPSAPTTAWSPTRASSPTPACWAGDAGPALGGGRGPPTMSAFDVAFVALAVLAVVGGYRLGFVARVVS